MTPGLHDVPAAPRVGRLLARMDREQRKALWLLAQDCDPTRSLLQELIVTAALDLSGRVITEDRMLAEMEYRAGFVPAGDWFTDDDAAPMS